MSILNPTKLGRQNDETWKAIVALLEAHGFEKDRFGNMVKGDKGNAIRYKRMARNVRKEKDGLLPGYDGKLARHWYGIWSIPLSKLAVENGKIVSRKV